jgi:hypothetical protein
MSVLLACPSLELGWQTYPYSSKKDTYRYNQNINHNGLKCGTFDFPKVIKKCLVIVDVSLIYVISTSLLSSTSIYWHMHDEI